MSPCDVLVECGRLQTLVEVSGTHWLPLGDPQMCQDLRGGEMIIL